MWQLADEAYYLVGRIWQGTLTAPASRLAEVVEVTQFVRPQPAQPNRRFWRWTVIQQGNNEVHTGRCDSALKGQRQAELALATLDTDCDNETLGRAAANSSSTIRRLAARHRRCPAGLLVRLIQDPESGVAQAAADNPSTPAYALALYQLAMG